MKPLHSWDVSVEEAIRIQEDLKDRIILKKPTSEIRTIGGGDVAYSRDRDILFGTIVVLSFPQMETLQIAKAHGNISFPYIPGLLSFREGPILIKIFQMLKKKPDVILFDGQGTSHPRRIGLASHLGLWLDLPSIGCAKNPLLDVPIAPGFSRGSFELIRRGGETVGAVLRTKDGVKPLFVSPGHQIDFPTSIQLVLDSCQGFRIPESLRKAHHLSRQMMHRAEGIEGGG
jgi:deoxyribonuclease V